MYSDASHSVQGECRDTVCLAELSQLSPDLQMSVTLCYSVDTQHGYSPTAQPWDRVSEAVLFNWQCRKLQEAHGV